LPNKPDAHDGLQPRVIRNVEQYDILVSAVFQTTKMPKVLLGILAVIAIGLQL
jgi:hypothetical protein